MRKQRKAKKLVRYRPLVTDENYSPFPIALDMVTVQSGSFALGKVKEKAKEQVRIDFRGKINPLTCSYEVTRIQ